MKKIYFLAVTLLALQQVNAQITLTKANTEPIVGDSYTMNLLDTTNTLPLNIMGNGVSWNVSGVSESGAVDTITYVSTSADPSSSNYTGCTIVEHQGSNSTYFKSTATQFELLGLNASMFNLNYNTNSAIVAVYPITMGYVNNDIGAGTITASISGSFTSTLQTTADATGTLNINNVINLTNCLRVKTTQSINFNLSVFETGTVVQSMYRYYHSSSKAPVFTVDYSHVVASGSFALDQWQIAVKSKNSLTTGLNETSLNDIIFKAYPNPTNHDVNIHFVLTQPESYQITILNNLGQVVKLLNKANLQAGLYNETIDVSDLSAGVYTIKVNGVKAQGSEKLIIE